MSPQVRSRCDGALYAVKVTSRPFRGPRDRRRALAEAGRQRAVGRHPQCVGLVAAWEERGVLYLQSELCPGGSLGGLLGGPPPPAWRILGYLWDLLQALSHLHGRRMAHGDVKPANALLTPRGVRLGDFGVLGEEGEGWGGEGDPRYLAPEVLGGGPGPPADVFSLGLTLLEVAAGTELPAAGEGWQELRKGGVPPHMARGEGGGWGLGGWGAWGALGGGGLGPLGGVGCLGQTLGLWLGPHDTRWVPRGVVGSQ